VSEFLKRFRSENAGLEDIPDNILAESLSQEYNRLTGEGVSLEDFNTSIGFDPNAPAPIDRAEPMAPLSMETPELVNADGSPRMSISESGMEIGQGQEQLTSVVPQPELALAQEPIQGDPGLKEMGAFDVPGDFVQQEEPYVPQPLPEPTMIDLIQSKIQGAAATGAEKIADITGSQEVMKIQRGLRTGSLQNLGFTPAQIRKMQSEDTLKPYDPGAGEVVREQLRKKGKIIGTSAAGFAKGFADAGEMVSNAYGSETGKRIFSNISNIFDTEYAQRNDPDLARSQELQGRVYEVMGDAIEGENIMDALDLASDAIASAVPSIVAMAATAGASKIPAFLRLMGFTGISEGGSGYDQAREEIKAKLAEEGWSDQDAQEYADQKAISAGIMTGVINGTLESIGFKNMSKIPKGLFLKKVYSILSGSLGEGVTEGGQSVNQIMQSWLSANPEADNGAIWDKLVETTKAPEVAVSMIAGAGAGGGMATIQASKAEDVLESELNKAVKKAKPVVSAEQAALDAMKPPVEVVEKPPTKAEEKPAPKVEAPVKVEEKLPQKVKEKEVVTPVVSKPKTIGRTDAQLLTAEFDALVDYNDKTGESRKKIQELIRAKGVEKVKFEDPGTKLWVESVEYVPEKKGIGTFSGYWKVKGYHNGKPIDNGDGSGEMKMGVSNHLNAHAAAKDAIAAYISYNAGEMDPKFDNFESAEVRAQFSQSYEAHNYVAESGSADHLIFGTKPSKKIVEVTKQKPTPKELPAPKTEPKPKTTQKGKKKPIRPIDTNKDSLLTAIKKLGGIQRQTKGGITVEDAGAADAKGMRFVFTNKGESIDKMVVHLQEQGYLAKHEDVNELLEKIRKEGAGKKQMSQQYDYEKESTPDYSDIDARIEKIKTRASKAKSRRQIQNVVKEIEKLPIENKYIEELTEMVVDLEKAFDLKEFNKTLKSAMPKKSRAETKAEPKTLKQEKVLEGPGAQHMGMYKTQGYPERVDSVRVDGRAVKIPEAPQRKEEIVNQLIKMVGRRIYTGKIKGSALGTYSPGTGVIRGQAKNDIEVLGHEAAHYLDAFSGSRAPEFGRLYRSESYGNEITGMSYVTGKGDLDYIEGFAEFVRAWLTNSTEAQKRAPKFYKDFNTLLKSDKKLDNHMRKLQVMMHKFYHQGPEAVGQALMGSKKSIRQKAEEWKFRRLERTRQASVDMFDAARRIEKSLSGKIETTLESPWKLLRMAKGGSESMADYVYDYGTIGLNKESGDIENTGKGLNDIFSPVETIQRKKGHQDISKVDLLMYYFAGRRALELHRQGRENLIPIETARAWVKYGNDYQVFKSIAKDFQAFNDRMLSFYVQAGLIDSQTKAAFQNKNKDYVPFNRVMDSLSGEGKGGGSLGSKLKGGTANIKDILVNIQDNLQSNVQASMKNMAKAKLYSMISSSKDGALWAARLSPDSKPVQVYKDEMEAKINKVLNEYGIKIEGGVNIADPEITTFWQHGIEPTLNDKGNIVDSVIYNGERHYYEVSDPLLQDMLINMNPHSYHSLVRGMFKVKNLFTRSITMGAEFAGANLVRDTMGATFLSKNRFIPFISSFSGMYSYFMKDQSFKDFMLSGGGGSSRIESFSKEGEVRKRMKVGDKKITDLPGKALSLVDGLMSAFEYGTRIGDFKLARKAGKSIMQSGFEGKEISTDFAQSGNDKVITGYIKTVPFLNAMIQSTDRLYREMLVSKKYDGNPTGFAMKAFVGITIPSLLLYWQNKDDEDYQKIPSHERRTNWHFKLPGGRFLKVPRPYDVGFTFATMPELFMKYVEDKDGKEFAEGMIWTMAQMYGIEGVPAWATGLVDVAMNEKWTGAPVVPKALEGLDPVEQYNATTSETFVKLGEMAGISPIKAEHMYGAQTGYLGGYLKWATDEMLWDEEKFGEKPDRDPADNPFIKRFITKKNIPSTYFMEKFFEIKEDSDRVTKTIRAGMSPRRMLKGKKLRAFEDDSFMGYTAEEKKVLYGLNRSLGSLTNAIYGKNGLKTLELSIVHNKNLTGAEKRKKIDALWQKRNDIFKKYYKAAKSSLDKAKKLAKEK